MHLIGRDGLLGPRFGEAVMPSHWGTGQRWESRMLIEIVRLVLGPAVSSRLAQTPTVRLQMGGIVKAWDQARPDQIRSDRQQSSIQSWLQIDEQCRLRWSSFGGAGGKPRDSTLAG